MIENVILAVAILFMFLCSIGIVICMGMFAERIIDLIKGDNEHEDKQQNI